MHDPLEDPLVRDVLEHEHASSRYRGALEIADCDGIAENGFCVTPEHAGVDRVRLTARVNAGRVVAVAFHADGCALAKGATALLARAMLGAHVRDVASWTETDVERIVGLPFTPFSVACAELALNAFRDGAPAVRGVADPVPVPA